MEARQAMSTPAPRFAIEDIRFFERDVVLRLPFRFGAATVTSCPQVYARARIRLPDGKVTRLIYSGRNGHPYTSLGRELSRRRARGVGRRRSRGDARARG